MVEACWRFRPTARALQSRCEAQTARFASLTFNRLLDQSQVVESGAAVTLCDAQPNRRPLAGAFR